MHLLPLLALAALAHATSLTLYLPPSPNPATLSARTRATLSAAGLLHAAPLTTANTFVFANLTPASYLIDVFCPEYYFAPLRVDVDSSTAENPVRAWETFRGHDWNAPGEQLSVKKVGEDVWGVEARSGPAKVYFMERPRFSILSILKTPMILMGLVSMVLFIGMPYLMDNMDPELKAEFEAQQAKGGPMAALMGGANANVAATNSPLGDFDVASYLAGAGKKEAPKARDATPVRNQGVTR